MTREVARHNKPIHSELHPRIYLAGVILSAWLVVSAWTFFAGSPDSGLIYAVVAGFFVIAIGVPVLLWRTWKRHGPRDQCDRFLSFRDWRTGQFDTSTGHRKASDAAAEALLPIAAVALAMTVFAVAFHFAAAAGA